MKASKARSTAQTIWRKKQEWLNAFPPTANQVKAKSPVELYLDGFEEGAHTLIVELIKAGVIDNADQERFDRMMENDAERSFKKAREFDRRIK